MLAKVRGQDLKSCLIDMTSLLKSYDRARVFGLSTTHDSITFTVDTGIAYTRTIPITDVKDAANYDMTVLFADIVHFIPGRGEVKLEITQYYVIIKTAKSTITLRIGESVVAPYKSRNGKLIDLDYAILRNATKVFSGTADLQKAYGRDFAITFYGNTAMLKSPTMWVRTKSQGLVCILSIQQLKSIMAFKPDYVEESDRLEFHKGAGILSVPKLTPTESDKFDTHKSKLRFVATIMLDGIISELTEMKRAIGVGDADIHIHPTGFNISMMKNGITLEESYNTDGESVYSFRYSMDLFVMSLNLLGEGSEIRVYAKEDMLCLENSDTSILMSV